MRAVPTRRSIYEVDDVWIPEQDQHLYDGLAKEVAASTTQSQKNAERQIWQENTECLFEWASLCAALSECTRTYWRQDHVNGYEVPEPRRAGRLAIITYEGFLSRELVLQAVTTLREAATSFVVTQCTGFADSPVGWLLGKRCKDPDTTPGSMPPKYRDEHASRLTHDAAGWSGSNSDTDDNDELLAPATAGIAARRNRNKARRKRGHTNAHHLGHQVAAHAPSPATSSGWQLLLMPSIEGTRWVAIEMVGGSSRS